MKNNSTLTEKLARAREALNVIVSRILEINKAKRQHQKPISEQWSDWKEELRVLNLIADRQARVIRVYESRLALRERAILSRFEI